MGTDVWHDEIESIRADLRGWLQRMAEQGETWSPIHTEFGFGFGPGQGRDAASHADPITLDGGWQLHGVVDLIERDASSKKLRVTDHKTGTNRTKDPMVVGGGEVLQPVLYGMAVEAALAAHVTESRLSFCTARGGFTERAVSMGEAERRAGVEVLEIVDRGVESGCWFPRPARTHASGATSVKSAARTRSGGSLDTRGAAAGRTSRRQKSFST